MSVYAQEYGYFFNSSNSDRRYNAESFETWLKPFFVSGVFTGGLQVQAQDTPDMTVKVTAGYANLDGKPARWPSDNNVTIQPASGVYDRIDTIVLRRNNTDRTISIEVVTGTASLNPTPTPPTRNGDIFELVIAQIRVEMGVTEILGSRITDTRPDTDLCGYVVAAVQTPDFSELFEQFESQAEEFFDTQSEEFMTWFDAMKDQLSEDAAGHLQEEIDDLSGEVDGAVKISAQSFSDAEKAQARENIGAESEQIEDDVAIVVRGNKTSHAGGAALGLYVILRQSTIAGCADGIYKAAKVIPYDTVIDNTYLTPVDGGVANGIQNDIGAKVADMSESLSSAIGIVVKGNKTTYTSGAAAGQFVILQESTIAGCADGLYVAAQAIPYNTAIDNTYLTAVSGGGLNALNASLMPKLLWENQNPNNAFSAQNISVQSYPYYLVTFKNYASYGSGVIEHRSVVIPFNCNATGQMWVDWIGTSSNNHYWRSVYYDNTNQSIRIGDIGGDSDTERLIPMRIYGCYYYM